MSGAPNREAVQRLKVALCDVAWHRERCAASRKSLAEAEDDVKRYDVGLVKAIAAAQSIMHEMDVLSPRNAGYEQRRVELLILMAEKML